MLQGGRQVLPLLCVLLILSLLTVKRSLMNIKNENIKNCLHLYCTVCICVCICVCIFMYAYCIFMYEYVHQTIFCFKASWFSIIIFIFNNISITLNRRNETLKNKYEAPFHTSSLQVMK